MLILKYLFISPLYQLQLLFPVVSQWMLNKKKSCVLSVDLVFSALASACLSAVVCGCAGPVWNSKTERAFFRGRDSREERLHLVSMSKKNPELLDAGITAFFFFREREKDLGKAPLVGFFDFFKVRETKKVLIK